MKADNIGDLPGRIKQTTQQAQTSKELTVAGQHLPGYVVALVFSMLACWLLNVSTAARLAGSTIVMLVPHTGSPSPSSGW
jgi:hypothetical protein